MQKGWKNNQSPPFFELYSMVIGVLYLDDIYKSLVCLKYKTTITIE